MRSGILFLFLAATACGSSPTKSQFDGTFAGYTPVDGLFKNVAHPQGTDDTLTGELTQIVLNTAALTCNDSDLGINKDTDTFAIIVPFSSTTSGDSNSQSILDGDTPIAVSSAGDGVYLCNGDVGSPNTLTSRLAIFALIEGNDPNGLHFAATGSVTISGLTAHQLTIDYDIVLDNGVALSGTATVPYCANTSTGNVANTSKVIIPISRIKDVIAQRMRPASAELSKH